MKQQEFINWIEKNNWRSAVNIKAKDNNGNLSDIRAKAVYEVYKENQKQAENLVICLINLDVNIKKSQKLVTYIDIYKFTIFNKFFIDLYFKFKNRNKLRKFNTLNVYTRCRIITDFKISNTMEKIEELTN